MNFGFNMNNGNFKPSEHPSSLTRAAKVVLTLLASFFMALCGAWNMLGIVSGNISIFVSVGFLSMLVYFVVGGICALLTLEAPRLSIIPPVVSFAFTVALGITVNGGFRIAILAAALLSVFPALGGAILAIAMKKGFKRPSAIIASSAGTGIFTAAVLALSVLLAGGVINGEVILSVIDQARVSLIEFLELQMGIAAEQMPQYDFSSFDPEMMVNGIFNLLPAIIIFVFNAIAFFSHLSLLALLRILDLYHKLERSDIEFKVSAISAALFAASYILSAVLSENYGVLIAVFDNLSMILMPAMAVAGLMRILPKKEGNAVRVGCFPLILTFFVLMFNFALGVLILAVFGTVYTFKDAYRNSKNKNNR